MSKKISGAEYPLAKIFSSEFDYVIPPYQRPYAWTRDQAGELFDDLYDFFEKEREDSYFLGSIVLIKDEGKPLAEVIDGQQRLTTLTILLAALTSLLTGDDRTDFYGFIREPGSVAGSWRPSHVLPCVSVTVPSLPSMCRGSSSMVWCRLIRPVWTTSHSATFRPTLACCWSVWRKSSPLMRRG